MAFVINSWENVLDLNDPKKNIYRDIENKKIDVLDFLMGYEWYLSRLFECKQGDSEISLEKNPVIGDHKKKS
jgi:hypothetical protein